MSFAELDTIVGRQDLRENMLKQWQKYHEVLLVVFCDEARERAGLLVLRRIEETVRYYQAFCH